MCPAAALLAGLGLCLLAARATGKVILDGVYNDISDGRFEAECRQGRQLGFDGKTLSTRPARAVQPGVRPAADEVETPGASSPPSSRRAEGRGVVTVDGRMVENLHVDGPAASSPSTRPSPAVLRSPPSPGLPWRARRRGAHALPNVTGGQLGVPHVRQVPVREHRLRGDGARPARPLRRRVHPADRRRLRRRAHRVPARGGDADGRRPQRRHRGVRRPRPDHAHRRRPARQAAGRGSAAGPTWCSIPSWRRMRRQRRSRSSCDSPAASSTTSSARSFETIAIPIDNGPDIEVRRRRLILTLPATLSIRTLDDMIAGTGTPLVVHRPTAPRRPRPRRRRQGPTPGRVPRRGPPRWDRPVHRGDHPHELAGTDTSREVEFDYGASVLEAVRPWAVARLGLGGVERHEPLAGPPDGRAAPRGAARRPHGPSFPDEWRQFLTRQGIDDFRTGHDWAVSYRGPAGCRHHGGRPEADRRHGRRLRPCGDRPARRVAPGLPGFRTKFTGEVIDACSCFGVDIDVNVAIEVKTLLRLAVGGAEPMIEVDWSPATTRPTPASSSAAGHRSGVLADPRLEVPRRGQGRLGRARPRHVRAGLR